MQIATFNQVKGRGGRTLAHKWQEEGTRTFVGLHTHGFPNLFIVAGPQGTTGPSGANSTVAGPQGTTGPTGANATTNGAACVTPGGTGTYSWSNQGGGIWVLACINVV